MKARVEAAAFAKTLKTVAPAAHSKGLPVLSGVRIEAGKGGLVLTCSDLDTTVTADLPADADKGVCVAPANLLLKLAATLTGAVELVADGNELTVNAGKTTATLRGFKPDDWPKVDPVEGADATLSADDLAAIGRVLPFHDTDPKTGARNCLNLDGNVARVTDGYRLGRVELAADCPPVTVPVPYLLKMFGALDGAAVTVAADDNRATFAAEHATWTVRQYVADSYPDVDKLLPTSINHRATFDRDALVDTLRRLLLLEQSSTAPAVKMATDGMVTTLSMAALDVGDIVTELPVDGTMPEVVGFNVRYLVDALAAFDDDEVTLEGVDHLKPWLIRSGDLQVLVMPTRLGL